jgi:spore coat polysaccharide biosynthesis predicted glycosyltransferase SpsG
VRADASRSIGSGHVMRSSAIAEELIDRGEEVTFVGEFSTVSWLTGRINNLGFSQIFSDVHDFKSDPRTDVLILDSYTVAPNEVFIQQNNWKAVVAIVDQQTPSYLADLLIHPAFSDDWIATSDTKVLAGPKYIPFRKSIQKNKKFEAKFKVLSILVVGGGTDTFNFAVAVCNILKKTQINFDAHIFTNSEEFSDLDSRFTLVPIGAELDVQANGTDLVFTTASTTSLEFIAREVAVGIACAVDNQEEYYETLSSSGVALPIGRFVENNWKIKEQEVIDLVNSNQLRERLQKKCVGLFDLNGAKRIVDEILKL